MLLHYRQLLKTLANCVSTAHTRSMLQDIMCCKCYCICKHILSFS